MLFSSGAVVGIVLTVVAVVVLALLILVIVATRYKKCPSDKVMVIYGAVGKTKEGTARSSRCIHGGAAFVRSEEHTSELQSH